MKTTAGSISGGLDNGFHCLPVANQIPGQPGEIIYDNKGQPIATVGPLARFSGGGLSARRLREGEIILDTRNLPIAMVINGQIHSWKEELRAKLKQEWRPANG